METPIHQEDTEWLKIFDNQRNEIGIASREEVHRLGHWHETFHCWFIGKEMGKDVVYFQLRSDRKKDYPNLLDISAAGHLLADESVHDGTREIREELGIDVASEDLEELGIVDYVVEKGHFIDKEIANVFLYRYDGNLEDFIVNKEEVTGVFQASFTDFIKLWSGTLDQLSMQGFKINEHGCRNFMTMYVEKHDFVPHEECFYQTVIAMIQQKIQNEHLD